MTEVEIENEAKQQLKKPMLEFVKDSIREANALRKNPAAEEQNLDIIKHLIKILAIHQVVLEKRASKTNYLLLLLTLFTVIAVLPIVINNIATFVSYINILLTPLK
ncbi:MAG: hypothetical protein ABSE17_03550 [Candidatus Levyibacteriota bacterium]|jgi:hypothetical protein